MDLCWLLSAGNSDQPSPKWGGHLSKDIQIFLGDMGALVLSVLDTLLLNISVTTVLGPN